MNNINFNILPLNIKKTFIQSANQVSSNENEAFRIVYYNYKEALFEVCIDLESNSVEDIRCINQESLDHSFKELILKF
ncbi:MAG: hypothetical protein CMO01_23610 [Thalassobius sp.]|nr:hypothetical protein [Thalassovita sp.]|tara:strand:- start:274 stop:507 length:234 start_codon:yes stop_codon:yes gene_type:complete